MGKAKEPSQLGYLHPGQRTIYEVTREWVTWVWLCETDAAARRARGETLAKIGETDQGCTDCDLRRQHLEASQEHRRFRLEATG